MSTNQRANVRSFTAAPSRSSSSSTRRVDAHARADEITLRPRRRQQEHATFPGAVAVPGILEEEEGTVEYSLNNSVAPITARLVTDDENEVSRLRAENQLLREREQMRLERERIQREREQMRQRDKRRDQEQKEMRRELEQIRALLQNAEEENVHSNLSPEESMEVVTTGVDVRNENGNVESLRPALDVEGFASHNQILKLKVPYGQEWCKGTKIVDHQGNSYMMVTNKVGSQLAVLGAVAEVSSSRKRVKNIAIVQRIRPKSDDNINYDAYRVLTYAPNYQGQKPLEDGIYLRGVLRQGRFGKNYKYYRFRNNGLELTMQADNGDVRCMLLCCPLSLGSRRVRFAFHDVQGNSSFVRDQVKCTLVLNTGINMIDAVCMAFALDYLVNPVW